MPLKRLHPIPITAVALLQIMNIYLYRQNCYHQSRNRPLILQNDSGLSVNLMLAAQKQPVAVHCSGGALLKLFNFLLLFSLPALYRIYPQSAFTAVYKTF